MTEAEIAALREGARTPAVCGPQDMSAVAADLSAAFATYPMFEWVIRDDARRDQGRLKLFNLMMYGTAQDGVVMRPPSGGAAAVWIHSDKLTPTPFWDELRGLPTLLSATGLRRFGRLAALRAGMDKHHPMDRPHIYLWLLGVRPEAQGYGVGSRLLQAGLERVDAQGLPAFLETSTEENVALYRRYGFEVISEYLCAPNSPPSWGMWREAPPA
jgi:ribosomal protein S18 acetylase RimI-like enzyme